MTPTGLPLMTQLSLQFTPEKADYTKAVRTFLVKNYESLAWLSIGLYLPLSVGHAWLISSSVSTSSLLLLTFLILALPPFILYRILFTRMTIDENMTKPFEWNMNAESLSISSPNITGRYEWDRFFKVMESQEYYFLVQLDNKNMFHFLPKRAFSDPQQENHFRKLVAAKYGSIQATKIDPSAKFAWVCLSALYITNIGLLVYSNFQTVFS
jgi:hypothetical protein